MATMNKKLFLGAGVVVVALVGGAAWRLTGSFGASPGSGAVAAPPSGKPAGEPVPVVVVPARAADVPIHLDGLGTVTAFNTVTVRSRIDGQIMQVAFREGQEVKAGDLLARIDPRIYETSLRTAQANRRRDEASLASAKADLGRFNELIAKGFASRQSVDQQKATVAQLEAAIAGDEAAIDLARIQLDYATITAPIDGRVGFRGVDVGNFVHAQDSTTNGIVTITQIKPISVVFTLPAETLPSITARADANPLVVEALSRDSSINLGTGALEVIDNVIDQTTGTIRLKAVFANADRALWPGQFVNARLLVSVRRQATVIPREAVQHGASGDTVFVARADDSVESRPVTLGPADGGLLVIETGLAVGERVVVEGQYRLSTGARILALPPKGQLPPA